MRIVLLLASPYPAPRGSQLLVRQIERGLRRRGHEVAVVSYGRWLRDRTGPHPARPLLDVLTLARVARVAWRTRAEILHAHNYEAGMIGLVAARLLGVPLVYHAHSRMEEELPTYARGRLRPVLGRVGAWLDRTIPRRADACLAVTTSLADRLRDLGALHVRVLKPTADPDEIRGLGSVDAEADAPTIAYAGNLDAYQNLGLLLEALALVRRELPAARLLVVTHVPGDVPAALEHPHVDVLRARTVAEAWRALGRAWVAAVPRTDPSGHPMKVLNYMAAGKAIVTTAAAAEGLRDGLDAVVVPHAEPKAFASAILELLRDPERRASLGAAAREAATSGAAWGAMMTALEDVYARVGRRRRPDPVGAPAEEA